MVLDLDRDSVGPAFYRLEKPFVEVCHERKVKFIGHCAESAAGKVLRWWFQLRRDVMERRGLEPAAAIALLADAIEFLPALLGLPAVTPMSANRDVEVCLGFADSLSAPVIPLSLGRNHAQQERAQECCVHDSTEPLIAGHR
jgi:hypothetical protein